MCIQLFGFICNGTKWNEEKITKLSNTYNQYGPSGAQILLAHTHNTLWLLSSHTNHQSNQPIKKVRIWKCHQNEYTISLKSFKINRKMILVIFKFTAFDLNIVSVSLLFPLCTVKSRWIFSYCFCWLFNWFFPFRTFLMELSLVSTVDNCVWTYLNRFWERSLAKIHTHWKKKSTKLSGVNSRCVVSLSRTHRKLNAPSHSERFTRCKVT